MNTQAVWTYNPKKEVEDSFVFSKNNLDHRKRIYKEYNIQPETLKKVVAEFVLQKEKLCRFIIKELDILLSVGGIFEIYIIDSKFHSAYFLSRDQVKYEFDVSTNGRYKLCEVKKEGKYLKLIYRKSLCILPISDSINKWSFGIVTNGKKNDKVISLINSICKQNIIQYEIIICGPFPNINMVDSCKLKLLDDIILEDDIRVPISQKKNKIIEAAQFNNLCILHDRFVLPDYWFQKISSYGNYFDLLCLPTIDDLGNRFTVDWMIFCFPLTKRIYRNKSLPYSKWTYESIIQGGVITGKRHLIRKYKLDERVYWDELEDMHFSKTAYLDGAFFYLDPNNRIISEAVNHKPVKKTVFYDIKSTINWLFALAKNFIKFHYLILMYYKNNSKDV